MAIEYRVGVHAVILDNDYRVLLLKQTYGDKRWGLPGGGVDPGESLHKAILRECREELGVEVIIEAFTGFYYHSSNNTQVGIFRARLPEDDPIQLSLEHSEYRWSSLTELGRVQQIRVRDAIGYNGQVISRSF